jgi:uncharacterized protein
MRILVLSDTHIPSMARCLPVVVENEAKRCDVCLHAGDFIDYQTYEYLLGLLPVHAVCGNMDDQMLIDKLPSKKVIEFDCVKIGLTHGRGAPDDVITSVDKIFADVYDSIDLFVFGHSHIATDKEIKGKIYFNPGSSTDTMFATKCTYGIIEINHSKITRKVVTIG